MWTLSFSSECLQLCGRHELKQPHKISMRFAVLWTLTRARCAHPVTRARRTPNALLVQNSISRTGCSAMFSRADSGCVCLRWDRFRDPRLSTAALVSMNARGDRFPPAIESTLSHSCLSLSLIALCDYLLLWMSRGQTPQGLARCLRSSRSDRDERSQVCTCNRASRSL